MSWQGTTGRRELRGLYHAKGDDDAREKATDKKRQQQAYRCARWNKCEGESARETERQPMSRQGHWEGARQRLSCQNERKLAIKEQEEQDQERPRYGL